MQTIRSLGLLRTLAMLSASMGSLTACNRQANTSPTAPLTSGAGCPTEMASNGASCASAGAGLRCHWAGGADCECRASTEPSAEPRWQCLLLSAPGPLEPPEVSPACPA
ncbi:MAG: hypothetical protein Q8Q09_07880 [Deltaproteobacteria bacterium]|nr:hypothetical protein [Deltaproteobacteria bacterium]